ncbi:MAG: glycosyltransferase family 39 protein [Planctomycetota bacterium]|nr:glycosyltransferase family 39 protein [Planctomycetota bacterium]
MSKIPKRNKPLRGRSAHVKDKTHLLDDSRMWYVLTAGLILVLAGVPFGLGKHFEFNSPEPFDGGAYLYSAQRVLSGARIGAEEKPSAQAGTLLVNMLAVRLWGFKDIGPKVLQMVFQAAALVFMFVTMRRLFGTLAAAIGVIIASVYLSAPLIAKYGNVKEQFMIAFMIVGVCCFVFYRLTGRWWWLLLAGATLVWGPMFKQTGLSAIAATGLFVLLQPVLRRESWKKAGRDLVLMTAGALVVLVPILGWYASMGSPVGFWPYSFLYGPLLPTASSSEAAASEPQASQAEPEATVVAKPASGLVLRFLPGYVRHSWEALGPAARKEAFLRVLRYYRLLILPILLALAAIVARLIVLVRCRGKAKKPPTQDDPGRFVPLLAVWWFLDMAFVWISPRSYEQYYLPLNASAAMLGGYLVCLYSRRLDLDPNRARWVVLGLLSVLVMMFLSWHIFFGIKASPHSGAAYQDSQGRQILTRGYVQKWEEVAVRQKGNRGSWEQVGQYIRERTEPSDTIYVWGWVPGIYVEAQRLSSAPKAFEGTMHTLPPAELADRVQELLDAFAKDAPKFIVDTRKRHFPWDRPPLELWPLLRGQFLPGDEATVKQYEAAYVQQLREVIEADEAMRFQVMKPLRDYVMKNYTIVGLFGEQVLFQRKD